MDCFLGGEVSQVPEDAKLCFKAIQSLLAPPTRLPGNTYVFLLDHPGVQAPIRASSEDPANGKGCLEGLAGRVSWKGQNTSNQTVFVSYFP